MNDYLDGNSVRLLESGADYFPALIQALSLARREVFLETYIFEDDTTGRQVAQALMDAAGRGACVHLLVDGFGGRAFVRSLRARLIQAGVRVLIYRREIGTFHLRRHRLRRLHRKLAVIDGRVAFVGGINVIDDLDPHGPPYPRLDYAVRIEGPVVAPILDACDRLWRLVAWASLRRRWREPLCAPVVKEPAGPHRCRFLIRDNLRHRREIEDAYLAAINAAQHEIWIACAYFLPGRRFRQALIEAAERGVSVNLVLQGLDEYPLLSPATRALYPHLLQNGVRLYEYTKSYLHAKVAVIDDHWATVGSSNIDPFSLFLAREANVVVADAGFALALRRKLQQAVAEGAQPLSETEWRRLPTLQRIRSWLAYQLVRLAVGIARVGGEH